MKKNTELSGRNLIFYLNRGKFGHSSYSKLQRLPGNLLHNMIKINLRKNRIIISEVRNVFLSSLNH